MTNEAAERLRAVIREQAEWENESPDLALRWLDDALTAERRATVERIRAALVRQSPSHPHLNDSGTWRVITAILDEEAVR